MEKFNPLIVALDIDTFDQAQKLVETLGDLVDTYKVGSQLFTVCGPQVIDYLHTQNKKIFLDLKFHDIPNTVASAVAAAVQLKVFMLTVHIQGGREMLEAAVQSARKTSQKLGIEPLKIIGVTVLTSVGAQDKPAAHSATQNKEKRLPGLLTTQNKDDTIGRVVYQRAQLAKEAGLDGVVASSQETAEIRKALGRDFLIITPGIRPAPSSVDDQKRVATPAAAIASGSTFLVVGRPIVQAANPHQAAVEILKEIKK